MTTLNEHPRQQLQIIIMQFGHLICDDPKLCEAMLRFLCPEHKREVNLLVTALKEKVAHDLLNRSAFMPLEVTIKNLSQRLQNNHGTAKPFADWAVESWALSLKGIQKPVQKQSIQRIGKFIVQEGTAYDTTTGLMWLRFAHGQRWQHGTVKGQLKLVDKNEALKVAEHFNILGVLHNIDDIKKECCAAVDTMVWNSFGYANAEAFDKEVENRQSNGESFDFDAWDEEFYN